MTQGTIILDEGFPIHEVANADGTKSLSVATTGPLSPPPNSDTVVLNFTDATQNFLSSIVYKQGSTTLLTITVTQNSATQQTFTKL